MTNFSDLLKLETSKIYLPKYTISNIAPESFEDVYKTFKETNSLVIWSGASKNTIWSEESSNWLFRAWHDYVHILSFGQFNKQGELKTMNLQQSQTESTVMQKLLNIEVLGQLEYFETNNQFPINQTEFFKGKLK